MTNSRKESEAIDRWNAAHMGPIRAVTKARNDALVDHVKGIATLQSGNKRLRRALKPFASIPTGHDERPNDYPLMVWRGGEITVGQVKEARAALKGDA